MNIFSVILLTVAVTLFVVGLVYYLISRDIKGVRMREQFRGVAYAHGLVSLAWFLSSILYNLQYPFWIIGVASVNVLLLVPAFMILRAVFRKKEETSQP